MSNLPFPDLEDDGSEEAANKIVAYQTAACDKQNPERYARFFEQERARFMVASKAHMAIPADAAPGTGFLEPIRFDDQKVKLANRNECAPIIDSEVARLIGSTAEPSVTPKKPTTVVHRAAKKSEMVLDDILTLARWVDILGQDARNTNIDGTSWLLGGWENDYEDMKVGPAMVHACTPAAPTGAPVGLGGPVKGCGWTMLAEGGEEQEGGGHRYTGDVAMEMVEAGVGSSVSMPGDEFFSATLHECPECKGPLAMRRALPEDGTQDAFGYELTESKPLPKVFVQGYPDRDVFPIGGGRSKFGFMPEVTIEAIVPIDWLMQRYEFANDVEGMSLGEMDEMGRWHPAGLECWGYAGNSLTTDQKRWAVYRITIRQPFKHPKNEKKDEPLGRLMISANKTVLMNGPLMFEYTTAEGEKELIPRMLLSPFANEVQNDSVHGVSTFSRLVSPQQALDAMMTQVQYDMATNGSPDLAVPKGANLEGQGDGMEEDKDDGGYPGRIIRYDADAGPPTKISGEVTHHDWVPISDGIVTHMQRTTAQSQLDQGKAASGAPSASAQMYIGQRLDETRKPKGQRWAERLSHFFSYLLECVVAVYTDRRQFKAVDALDNRTVRDFAGADLLGQTTVKVATKPAHDNEAFQRQNIIEALAQPVPLIDLSTPRQRLRVAKKLGIEDEIDAEPNQQIKDAQDEFLDWTLADPPKPPVAKKRTDNHVLHPQTHMEDYRSPAGEAMRRMASFHELATDGWYEAFKGIMMAEKRLKTPGGMAPEPVVVIDELSPTGAVNTPAMIAQKDARAADEKLLKEIEALPKNTQERIEAIQTKMVEAYEPFSLLTAEDQADEMANLKWLCHCEAHEWYALEAAMDAMPPPAATQTPGAPAPTTSAAAPSGAVAGPSVQ